MVCVVLVCLLVNFDELLKYGEWIVLGGIVFVLVLEEFVILL